MNLTNLADIRALLARHDFHFSKSLGQNFLTAAWVPADMADASGADAGTGVLEVGPGIGCLTAELAVRFLDDYLRGDPYFKITSPDHNLVRTRCQLALAKDMLKKRGEMEALIREQLEKIR